MGFEYVTTNFSPVLGSGAKYADICSVIGITDEILRISIWNYTPLKSAWTFASIGVWYAYVWQSLNLV